MLKRIVPALALLVLLSGMDYLGSRQAEDSKAIGNVRYEIVLFESPLDPGGSRALLESAFARIEKAVAALGDGPGTALARLNAAKAGTAVPLDADAFELLSRALAVARLTDGYFDVTDGDVRRLWSEARAKNEPPPDATIETALPKARYDAILLDPESRTATVRRAGFRIDWGTLVRARALDAAAELLRDRGVTSALLSAGDDLRLLGRCREASAWRVGVDHPRRVDRYAAVLELSDGMAVSTVSDAEDFFIHRGKRYAAFYDHRSGRARDNEIASVVLRAKDSVTARALGEALFAMGPVKGFTLLEGLRAEGAGALCIEEKKGEDLVISGSDDMTPHLKDIRL